MGAIDDFQERKVAMAVDVRRWLVDLGLESYWTAFEDNAVDGDLLPSLTADDLKEIGITKVGHRRRLLDAAAALAAAPAQADSTEDAQLALHQTAFERHHRFEHAERRKLTILVCDIAGSAELATKLDPEPMRDLVATFQKGCAQAVRKFGGYLGPFLGDAIIAYFGFPRTLENDAESALRAGLAMARGIETGIAEAPHLDLRVGIASGLCVVGTLDDPSSAGEQTVIGDIPTLASRLQTLAPVGAVVCEAVTRRLAGDLFRFQPLGEKSVKGFSNPIEVHRVLGESDFETRFAATRTGTIAQMIGRSHEHDLVLERWSMAERGEGQVVLINGIPGIGKSRLVRSLLDTIGERGHRRMSFQCQPLFAESPLYPVVRLIESAAGVTHDDPAARRLRKLRRFFSSLGLSDRFALDLGPLFAEPQGSNPQLTPDRLRASTFSALADLFAEVTRGEPTLIVVEDAHWIDPSTRELVQQMLAGIADRPVLFVMTARPDADIRWLQAFDPLVVNLMKLTRSQVAEFLQEIFGDRVISIPIARQIINRTDGIPLFIEEVCRSLIERGSLQPDETGRIDMEASLSVVPATLYDTLLSRLDHNLEAKSVAQVASVIGREFNMELLRSVFAGSASELENGLHALLAAELVQPVSNALPGLYAFKHSLTDQATYETLLLRHREELHARIADRVSDVLPAFSRNRPEIQARHLTLAGAFADAARAWLAAGQQALNRGAYEESGHHLRAGLGAVRNLEDDAARDSLELPLQLTLAQALRSARFTGGDEALEACRRGRELAERLGRRDDLLKVLRFEFGILFNRPDIRAAQNIARTFSSHALLRCEPAAIALGEQALGKVLFFAGAFEESYGHLVRSLEDRERIETPELLTHFQYPVAAMVYQAFAAFCLGRSKEARTVSDEAIRISKDTSEFTYSLTLANILILEMMQEGSDRTTALLDELRLIAIARGAPFWVDLVGFHEGLEAIKSAGDVEAGLARMRKALATFEENSVEVEIPFYQAILADALISLGSLAEAAALLADARGRIERTEERWPLSEVLRLDALCAHALGDHDLAARRAGEARQVCAEQGAVVWAQRLDDLPGDTV